MKTAVLFSRTRDRLRKWHPVLAPPLPRHERCIVPSVPASPVSSIGAGTWPSREFRGIATRYGKLAVHAEAAVFLPAIAVYWTMSLEPTA